MNQPLVKRSRKLLLSSCFLEKNKKNKTIRNNKDFSDLDRGEKENQRFSDLFYKARLIRLKPCTISAIWFRETKMQNLVGRLLPCFSCLLPGELTGSLTAELVKRHLMSFIKIQNCGSCSCRLQVPSSTNTLSSVLFVDDDYFARKFRCKMTLQSRKLPLPCKDTAVL